MQLKPRMDGSDMFRRIKVGVPLLLSAHAAKTNQHSPRAHDIVRPSFSLQDGSKLVFVSLHLHAVVDTYDCITSYTISVSWRV